MNQRKHERVRKKESQDPMAHMDCNSVPKEVGGQAVPSQKLPEL